MDEESANSEGLASRRAIEALRSGVPNRDAVRVLGSNQPRAEKAFAGLLGGSRTQAMLVSGDFGAGKSHLLAYLEQMALSDKFVTSKVVISKETPLYDLGKVLTAALENGRVPDRKGIFVEELAEGLRSGENYDVFSTAIGQAAADEYLSQIFPASRLVHERTPDPDLKREMVSFWAGERPIIANVRRGLREIGEAKRYKFSAPRMTELPKQRLRFVAELVRGAGYKGWVVFLDEIELMGSYTILQRARAYAEVARWMGRIRSEICPGLVVVGAVTENFVPEVLGPEGKQDRDKIGPRLRSNERYRHLVDAAEAGMGVFRDADLLESPDDATVAETLNKLRGIYGRAYDCSPPPASGTGGAGFQGRMRYKVRAAINEWDLHRQYPNYSPRTVADEFQPTYEEDEDRGSQTAAGSQ